MRRMVPSESLTVMPLRSTSVTMALSWISTPIFSSRALRLQAELLAHRRQHRGRGVEQDHPGLGGVDVPERALEGVVGQFRDLPGHLDTGGAGADDDERQQLLAAFRVAGPLGLLERTEDPAAQFQRVVDRLHAGRELGEVVVAEVGLAGARGDDQAVVRACGRCGRAAPSRPSCWPGRCG